MSILVFAILLVVTEVSLFLILTCRQHIRLKLKSFIYFTLRYITLKLPTFSLLGKTNRKKFCFSFCPFATYTSKTIIQWKTITFGLRHKHTRTNHKSTYLLIPELASSFFIWLKSWLSKAMKILSMRSLAFFYVCLETARLTT